MGFIPFRWAVVTALVSQVREGWPYVGCSSNLSLTVDGVVFTWGNHREGQLGRCADGLSSRAYSEHAGSVPYRVDSLDGESVCMVAAGAFHNAALLGTYVLYVFCDLNA
jgi:alpha-tubulin suppressor-like RCC1 family protein